jgi:hypothetical protein
MRKFDNQLEILSDLVFEEEDFSKAQALIVKMIQEEDLNVEIETFSEFLSISADAIEGIESSDLYIAVTDWAVSKYNHEKSREITGALQYAGAINTWLNHKIELVDDPAITTESRIALGLFSDIIENTSLTKAAEELTNDYQGYSTYSLLVGISEANHALIENAIDAQRKVLCLYQNGKFPEYYNLNTFVAGAKRSLASTLIEAYEFDNSLYTRHHEETGELLNSALKDFESCGTDFDREYTLKLLRKYESYVP